MVVQTSNSSNQKARGSRMRNFEAMCLSYIKKHCLEIKEVATPRLGVQHCPQIHTEPEVSLSYLRHCLKLQQSNSSLRKPTPGLGAVLLSFPAPLFLLILGLKVDIKIYWGLEHSLCNEEH